MSTVPPPTQPLVVLGGSGFIGTRLVGRLKGLGHDFHYGDMDFKVVGTTKGITALQMDAHHHLSCRAQCS